MERERSRLYIYIYMETREGGERERDTYIYIYGKQEKGVDGDSSEYSLFNHISLREYWQDRDTSMPRIFCSKTSMFSHLLGEFC